MEKTSNQKILVGKTKMTISLLLQEAQDSISKIENDLNKISEWMSHLKKQERFVQGLLTKKVK